MGHEGAFAKAMQKKPGGFGASTASRFGGPKNSCESTPAAGSYSPEGGKDFVHGKRSGASTTGGFGASKSSRFGGPKESSESGPSATSYSPEHGKDWVGSKKGGGASLGPKTKRTAGDASLGRRAATAAPSRSSATVDYRETLATIEASIHSPPPCELGIAAADAAWFEQNATAEGVVVLPCGLQYKELARGRSGKSPKLRTPCECHFRSFLVDGTEFDSSFARGQSFTFTPDAMVQGWTVAMQLMGEGDTWELYVPPAMAYGDRGQWSEKRGQYARTACGRHVDGPCQ